MNSPTDAGGNRLGLSIVRLRAALATWLPRGKRNVMSSVLQLAIFCRQECKIKTSTP